MGGIRWEALGGDALRLGQLGSGFVGDLERGGWSALGATTGLGGWRLVRPWGTNRGLFPGLRRRW